MIIYLSVICSLILLFAIILSIKYSPHNKELDNIKETVNTIKAKIDAKNEINFELLKRNEEEISKMREHYIKSLNNTITIAHLSLFKMYDEMQILDFDTISEEMKRNMELLVSNPQMLQEWDKKFYQYISSKTNDNDMGDL